MAGISAFDGWVRPSPKPPPDLTPLFGPQLGWSPDRPCHEIHGPIPSGSKLICMRCHKCGVEHLTYTHVKPGNGQLREGWQTAEQPTKYTPPPKGLRGGTGR